MARITQRRLRWDAPTDDIAGWDLYVNDDPAVNEADFLAQADAGQLTPYAQVEVADGPVWIIDGLDDAEYDFAVIARDGRGNFSDPLSPEVWQDVPLDVTPPLAPTGGVIESV